LIRSATLLNIPLFDIWEYTPKELVLMHKSNIERIENEREYQLYVMRMQTYLTITPFVKRLNKPEDLFTISSYDKKKNLNLTPPTKEDMEEANDILKKIKQAPKKKYQGGGF